MPTKSYKLNEVELKNKVSTNDVTRIYVAEVMDTRTPLYNGDIKVWILTSGSDKSNPNNWLIAHCADSHFGNVLRNIEKADDKFINQQTSFGWWNPIPYVGNYVFIFYPSGLGEMANPYWFGGLPNNMNKMLPGISYNLEQDTENNDYTPLCESNFFANEKIKPTEYPMLDKALKTQGLDKDLVRGISTASSFREVPSMCYGFLSPLGNQFVIDDGWSNDEKNLNWNIDPRKNDKDNEEKDDYGKYHNKKEWKSELNEASKDDKLNRFNGGFRFRTRNGTQLLILDSGSIYAINKDGSAWVELSEDGYIDCYSQKGISASSEGDINLHSNKNINIEAEDTINIRGKKGVIVDSSGKMNMNCGEVNVSSSLSSQQVIASIANVETITSMNAQLNGVFQGSLNGTAYFATYAGVTPEPQASPLINTVTIKAPNNVKEQMVEQKVGEGQKSSITTRIPTHEPYAGHDKNKFIPKMISRLFKKKKEINKIPTREVKSNTI